MTDNPAREWMVGMAMRGHVLPDATEEDIITQLHTGIVPRTFRCDRCAGWFSPIMGWKGVSDCPGYDVFNDGG
jgi:hypothetical protein